MEFPAFRRAAIKKLMEEKKLDLLIASLPTNVYYLSGYQSIGHNMLNRIQVYALYPRSGDSLALVIPYAEIPSAQEQVADPAIYPYGNFVFSFGKSEDRDYFQKDLQGAFPSPGEALLGAIKGTVKKGVIGFDESRVPPQIWKDIESLPEFKVVPASDYFGEARMVKHPEEISRLERAAEIAETAMHSLFKNLRRGMSEIEMGQFFMQEVTAMDAEPFFNVFTIDERSPLVDTINTEKSVREGSIIRIDAGCVYKKYRSDMARTAVVGEAPPKLKKYYDAILAGEEEAMSRMEPGRTAEEIFNIAVQEVRKGIPHFDRHHCGHGIGLEVYDPPLIAPGIKQELLPGMVFCVETPYYELGWGGIQVEDPVEITPSGNRILTKGSRKLFEVELV